MVAQSADAFVATSVFDAPPAVRVRTTSDPAMAAEGIRRFDMVTFLDGVRARVSFAGASLPSNSQIQPSKEVRPASGLVAEAGT